MTTAAEVLRHQVRLFEALRDPDEQGRDYVRRFAGKAGLHHKYAEVMFYPWYRRRAEDRAADWEGSFLKSVSAGLFAAPAYQVTAPMMEVAASVAENTAGRVTVLQAADMPSESGFLWMDRQFPPDGREIPARAVSWAPMRMGVADWEDRWHDDAPAVRLMAWSEERDFIPRFGAPPDGEPRWGTLIMSHAMTIPLGMEFGPREPDGRGPRVLDTIRQAVTLWMLLGSELPARTLPRPDKSTSRRALRTIAHDQVTVITLRRRAVDREGREYAPHEVDWSCRWVVQGHHRHLEEHGGARHAARDDGTGRCGCGARVTWVRPHVKGPEGRPLRHAEHLYRLSR